MDLPKDVADINRRGLLKDAYFDYDKADLRDDARATLSSDAEWLKKYRTVQFLIEGHCDERGTSEYNLALGDRRANAVKEYLDLARGGRLEDQDRLLRQGAPVLHRVHGRAAGSRTGAPTSSSRPSSDGGIHDPPRPRRLRTILGSSRSGSARPFSSRRRACLPTTSRGCIGR